MKVLSGLDVLFSDKTLQNKYKGNIALLSHNASIDSKATPAASRFKEMFGSRFIKMFGPQHGFASKEQDNMIETDHDIHPYFKIPVFSLYSETRVPTEEMLHGIDHFFIDLQDVGSRMYTYIYTMTLVLEKCANHDIEVIILDRPNPLNGVDIEGNLLESEFSSFIGRHPIPVRHAMTMGEVALMHQKFWAFDQVQLQIVPIKFWQRNMFFEETGLTWVSPSPNLARSQSVYSFPAIVLFEGTELSEGRGTTQALEIMGHPALEPFTCLEELIKPSLNKTQLEGFSLRPVNYVPTFHKFTGQVCGGFQIHVTEKKRFRPWRTGQFLLREMYQDLGPEFQWLQPPYEYNDHQMPIDIINGTDKLRLWVENNESIEQLDTLENLDGYQQQLNEIKIY